MDSKKIKAMKNKEKFPYKIYLYANPISEDEPAEGWIDGKDRFVDGKWQAYKSSEDEVEYIRGDVFSDMVIEEKKKNVKRLVESFDTIKDNLLEDVCKWLKENYHEYDGRDEFRMDLLLYDLKAYFKTNKNND